jgi:hypothetical protein
MLPISPLLVRGWRAALLLVAVACSTPGRASAGCGDYITYPDSHKNSHAAPMTADHGATPAKAPCDGRDCSGKSPRDSLPIPAAPSGSPQAKVASRQLGDAGDSDAGPASILLDPTSSRPIRRAPPIFHPPRAH